MRFEDIPDNQLVKVGSKEKLWYEVYKFSEKQEEEWRAWALGEMKKEFEPEDAESYMREIELRYGFVRYYKKEGSLF